MMVNRMEIRKGLLGARVGVTGEVLYADFMTRYA
jgi:hypothetical protein